MHDKYIQISYTAQVEYLTGHPGEVSDGIHFEVVVFSVHVLDNEFLSV